MPDDVKVAVGSATGVGTSTGTEDLTISGLGWTPKAILAVGTRKKTSNSKTDLIIFSAVSDGQRHTSVMSNDNVATTSTRRRGPNNSGTVIEDDAGTLIFDASSANSSSGGPISDGWRLDIDTADADGYDFMFLLFGGADLKANVGGFQDTSTSGTIALDSGTGDGQFESDLLVTFGPNAGPTTGSSQCNFHLGFVVNGGAQHSAGGRDENGRGTTDSSSYIRQNEGSFALSSGTGNFIDGITYSSFTSTGFDYASAGGFRLQQYLALQLGSSTGAHVQIIDSPTSTGSDYSITGAGFTPQAAIIFGANVTAVDTTTADLAFNLLTIDGDNRQASLAFTSEDNVATSNVDTFFDGSNLDAYLDDSGPDWTLTPASAPFNSDGLTIPSADVDVADGTARKWISLLIEDPGGGGSIIPQIMHHRRMQGMS